MTASAPFTIGLVQDGVAGDRAATIASGVASIREAARRGAQVICLKELFDAPYFCKSLNIAKPDGWPAGKSRAVS